MYIKSIITVITVVMLFSCENSISKIKEITIQADTLATIATYNMIYDRSDSGNVRVELKSELMKRFAGDDAYSEFPYGFEITFFDKLGNRTSIITANYGITYDKRKFMNARDNVVIKNFDTHEELYTENLMWDQKKKIIKSNTFVKMIKPDKVIFGDSMRSNEAFTVYHIYGIKGEFEVEESDDNNN
jgi:LPS export ABC transporter protein LptC